jgi:hypothetical protein
MFVEQKLLEKAVDEETVSDVEAEIIRMILILIKRD